MKLKTMIVVFIAVIGLVGVRLATLIDDPEHLITPDEDCPICQAYHSQVLLVAEADLNAPPTLLLYLSAQIPIDPNIDIFHPILSIRAPPIS